VLRQVNAVSAACGCKWRDLTISKEPQMVERVLIATDGSDHSRKAVEFGSDIASKYGAEVVLVHVLLHGEVSDDLKMLVESEHLAGGWGDEGIKRAVESLPPGLSPPHILLPGKGASTTYEHLNAIGERILDDAEHLAREHGAGRITRRLEDGRPVDEIIKAAKAENVDLVVCGARGLSDLQAIVMGSVSHKLTQLSPATCISVH
jgi:nucleotide-binding universal stress UspA family protein